MTTVEPRDIVVSPLMMFFHIELVHVTFKDAPAFLTHVMHQRRPFASSFRVQVCFAAFLLLDHLFSFFFCALLPSQEHFCECHFSSDLMCSRNKFSLHSISRFFRFRTLQSLDRTPQWRSLCLLFSLISILSSLNNLHLKYLLEVSMKESCQHAFNIVDLKREACFRAQSAHSWRRFGCNNQFRCLVWWRAWRQRCENTRL